MKQFYDSLELQTLPVSYSEDYVRFLPAFKPIPQEIIPFMDLPECNEPKAVCLPESLGAKLILIAVDEQPHLYSLWLYSLDDDFRPTSDYEIHLLDYSQTKKKTNSEEIFYIDSSRKFTLHEISLE